MVDKRKYNAKMNAKGLEKVLTDEQAGVFCRNQGRGGTFIVRAHAGPKTVDEDGSETVNLILDEVEFVPTEHEDRVARFQRALYLARPEQFGQEAFAGTLPNEPKVDDTARELDSAVQTGDDGQPVGVWSGDPEAPLEPEDKGDDGLKGDEVWPGDEPKGEPAATDEVSKKRAGRKKAGTTVDAEAQDIPEEPVVDEAAERLKQARAALGGSEDEDAAGS